MSAEEVAKAFVGHFYQTFDSNVEALSGLYVSVSLLLFALQKTKVQLIFFVFDLGRW